MKQIRLIRELRIKNLEAFKLREDFYGDIICFMLLADFNRPSHLDDFPKLKGIEDENDFGRSNYIKVVIIHSKAFDTSLQEEIVSIAGGFLENKDDCHWNTEFEKVDEQEFINISEDRTEMLKYFELVLKKYSYNIELNIEEDKFN